MRKYLWLLLPAILGIPSNTPAENVPPRLLDFVSKLLPGTEPDRVTQSPISGIYEVTYGAQVLYVHESGRYLIQGDLVDLNTHTNLTEDRRRQARLKAIEALGENTMIVFAPQTTTHTLTVFTDVDCGYCRKFHQEVKELTRHGVKVRYLAFPRAGIPSPTYDKMVSVWCAEDPRQAITDAKRGNEVPAKQCENPVQAHYEAAHRLGISGTPAMVLDDGEIIPGYIPAERLVKMLATGPAR